VSCYFKTQHFIFKKKKVNDIYHLSESFFEYLDNIIPNITIPKITRITPRDVIADICISVIIKNVGKIDITAPTAITIIEIVRSFPIFIDDSAEHSFFWTLRGCFLTVLMMDERLDTTNKKIFNDSFYAYVGEYFCLFIGW